MAQTTTPVQTSNGFGALLDGHDLQQRQFVVSQLNEFTYQLELRQRLQACLCSLAQQIPLHNIGCVQVGGDLDRDNMLIDHVRTSLAAVLATHGAMSKILADFRPLFLLDLSRSSRIIQAL